MTKEQKNQEIASLVEELKNNEIFYIADTSTLNASATSQLRRDCFKSNIKLRVVKNTLLKKAMERVEGKDYSPLFEALHGTTAVMYSEVGNAPARLIKEFSKKYQKPAFKAAFIQEDCYVGADQLDTLVALKSNHRLTSISC
jgi:large subunit ribosomal protein L10